MNRYIPIVLLSSLVVVGCNQNKKADKEPTPPSELTSPAQPTPIPATPVYPPAPETAVAVAPAPAPAPVKAAPAPVTVAKPAATAAKPAAAPAKPADTGSKTYVVKKGDSLSEIAKAHNTTVKKLMALNPAIKSADKIEVGEKIKLP